MNISITGITLPNTPAEVARYNNCMYEFIKSLPGTAAIDQYQTSYENFMVPHNSLVANSGEYMAFRGTVLTCTDEAVGSAGYAFIWNAMCLCFHVHHVTGHIDPDSKFTQKFADMLGVETFKHPLTFEKAAQLNEYYKQLKESNHRLFMSRTPTEPA